MHVPRGSGLLRAAADRLDGARHPENGIDALLHIVGRDRRVVAEGYGLGSGNEGGGRMREDRHGEQHQGADKRQH